MILCSVKQNHSPLSFHIFPIPTSCDYANKIMRQRIQDSLTFNLQRNKEKYVTYDWKYTKVFTICLKFKANWAFFFISLFLLCLFVMSKKIGVAFKIRGFLIHHPTCNSEVTSEGKRESLIRNKTEILKQPAADCNYLHERVTVNSGVP